MDPRAAAGLASIIVVTHNDANTLAPLLDRVLAEPLTGEVLVVASGSNDGTVPLVAQVAERDRRVTLFVEAERSGKASAINFGVARAICPFVVVLSGDVLPEPGAIGLLLAALQQPGVGIAGGRPVPDNPRDGLMGHAVHLLWDLHDRLARRHAKVGEVSAVRGEALSPLPRTSVDEASIQSAVEQAGWSARYVPEAVIVNRGPTTPRDFVSQRRRIHAGHLALRGRTSYTVPSLHVGTVASELLRCLRADREQRRPRRLWWTAGTIVLEATARGLARWDRLRRRELYVWGIITSAKLGARGEDGGGAGARPGMAPVFLAETHADQRDGQRDLPL